MTINVLGSIIRDMVLKCDRVPKEGESYFGNEYHFFNGGKGANQAVALARLNERVNLFGAVGKDENGQALLDALRKEKVNTKGVLMSEKDKTGIAVIMVESGGKNRIMVYPAANFSFSGKDIMSNFSKENCDGFLSQLETSDDSIIETFSHAIKQKKLTVLDCGPARKFPLKEIKGLTVITPNETEAEVLTGVFPSDDKTIDRALKTLIDLSEARYAVLKMGGRGCALYCDGKITMFPAHSVNVVDTTAAGDSFTAALTKKLNETGDIFKAVRFAQVAGALAVTRLGAQPSMPHLKEIEEFISARNLII